MGSSIKGHQTSIKIYKAGQVQKILHVTKFNVNQDSSFSRSYYVGAPYGEGDQSIEGWSGSLDVEVKDSSVDDLIDAIITGNLNGLGLEELTIVDTELYTDGTTSTYVFSDVQMKMSKSVGGVTEKVTKKLDFQASLRTKV